MKEEEVKLLLAENNIEWKDFNEWIFGQTVGIDQETDEILYYPWDVKRFVRSRVNGTPTYFD